MLLGGKLKVEMTDALSNIFIHLNKRNIFANTCPTPVSKLLLNEILRG
jgi:hypothetical protein